MTPSNLPASVHDRLLNLQRSAGVGLRVAIHALFTVVFFAAQKISV